MRSIGWLKILAASACVGGLLFVSEARAQRAQPTTPKPDDVAKVREALPSEAPAKPAKPRSVLVFGKAAGFVHSSIPLGCEAVKLMGDKTGAYKATISYDPAMFDPQTLSQFDAIILVSTTGDYLDDPKDKPASDKRREALINFVRGGKGVVGFHAASDAYYDYSPYGEMIGGYFSNHKSGKEQIEVINEDPKSALTAAFGGKGFEYHDEIYRFLPNTKAKNGQVFSRSKVHVLLSVDVEKNNNEKPGTEMPVSWIHQVGQGRVFYNSLGHNEFVWYDPTILKYDLAGIQYAIGDLKADAAPSGATKTASAK